MQADLNLRGQKCNQIHRITLPLVSNLSSITLSFSNATEIGVFFSSDDSKPNSPGAVHVSNEKKISEDDNAMSCNVRKHTFACAVIHVKKLCILFHPKYVQFRF